RKRFWLLPALSYEIGKLLLLRFWFSQPDIVYDGFLDPHAVGADGKYKKEYLICIRNNGNAKFVMADAPNNFKNMSINSPEFDFEGTRIGDAAR
ncbi:MAG TPA: hypothetical protein VNJ07_10445, partial [Chitinophagales bacterium]|nr:hypothetical protein [Chitinophagales bacterium]